MSAPPRPTQPNVLVIGAARSGTTALVRALEQHPEVSFTDPKEVHFFAHANAPVLYRGPGDDLTVNRPMVSDPTEFAQLFGGAETKVRGEGSVSTLFVPERSIPAISTYAAPGTKVIVMLREPAARAYSAYLLQRGRGHEELESFADGLAAEPERAENGYQHIWQYRAMSRYHEQLPAFVAAFGADLWVGIMEELRAEPHREIERLCQFLEIDPGYQFDLDIEINRGGEPRSRALSKTINVAWRLKATRKLVLTLSTQGVRDRIRGATLSRPDADPAVMADLRQDLRPAVDYVEALLCRPIDLWHPPETGTLT